jgi:hypothetical protein|tara:strand:+ start:1001 stop:1858 length:858 start_codon:yes stop_codon:yes gene_type:complete
MISFNYLASPGQLGNQMFKYAALKGISHELNTTLLMPPSYNVERFKPVFKMLKKFNLIDHRNYNNHSLFKYFKMESVKKNNIGYSDLEISITEDSFEFDPKFFSSEIKSFDVYGFFQSYKYFENIKNDLIRDFTFKDEIQSKSKLIYNNLDNPISIHVRRGDYLVNPNHNVLELDYYKKSMDWLGSKNNYVIFSDDNQWCKQQPLFSSDNIKFAEDLTNGREELDLCLMSLCDKHIIANSTFSWWGAYLSNQETIIVPDKWFKGSNFSNNNTSDLYPKNWYLVEN